MPQNLFSKALRQFLIQKKSNVWQQLPAPLRRRKAGLVLRSIVEGTGNVFPQDTVFAHLVFQGVFFLFQLIPAPTFCEKRSAGQGKIKLLRNPFQIQFCTRKIIVPSVVRTLGTINVYASVFTSSTAGCFFVRTKNRSARSAIAYITAVKIRTFW